MAAFNVEAAARQGRSETLPAAWTKFPAAKGAIQTNIIIYTVGALLLFGLAVYVLITGSLPGGTPGDGGLEPFELVGLFLFGCFFLSISLRMIPALRHTEQYFFLITNDGFVYAAGKKLMGLPLANVSIAYRQVGLLGGKLVVSQRAGSALNIPLGRLYTTRAVREIEEALEARVKTPNSGKRAKRA